MWVDETQLKVGSEIGDGGEANVFLLTDLPDNVFKKYRKPVSSDVRAKLEWMVNHPPSAEAQQRLTWPTRLVSGANGELSGYIMRRLPEQTVDLGTVFTQSRDEIKKQLNREPFTFRDRHVIAMNLALTLAACHREGYVIVDFNHNNIHVSAKGHVVLIDNDSFQIRGTNGTHYPCNGVAVPEYHSPELTSSVSAGHVKSTHDAFVLATLIFKLLMDSVHPFRGSTDLADADGPPDEAKLLKQHMYPYDVMRPRASVRPHQKAPPLARLHKSIVRSLQKCFTRDGLEHPDRRPTAEAWSQTLQRAITALGQCKRGHWYSTDRSHCLTRGGKGDYCASTARTLAGSIPSSRLDMLTGVLTPDPSAPPPPQQTQPHQAQPKRTQPQPSRPIQAQRPQPQPAQPRPQQTQLIQTLQTRTQPTQPQQQQPTQPVQAQRPQVSQAPPTSSPPPTSPGGTSKPSPRPHIWQTGNATVDGVAQQAQVTLDNAGQSLSRTWETAKQRANGKAAGLLAVLAITVIAFQTGLMGGVLGFASTVFNDDAIDPAQVTARGGTEAVQPTNPSVQPTVPAEKGTGDESHPDSGQPTIASNNETQPAGTSWLVVATSGGSRLYVNREPNLRFPINAYAEGTHLEILDADIVSADGYHWQRVKAPDGVEGWVATEYTQPSSGP